MQRSEKKGPLQLVVTQARESIPTPYKPPTAEDSCRAGGSHKWGFLMPGFQMCTKCMRIRRKPANGGDE